MWKIHANNTGYTNIYFWRRWGWKTQQAVIDACEAHKRGATVITNIWLNFPHIRFKKTKDLVPILYEIADYCHNVVMPIMAPKEMLKDYEMKRDSWSIREFFILWDEIGKNLNNRNWQKNFADDEILLDMLTEPRKYWLTIIGVANNWKMIDSAFRTSTDDWFLFSKTGKWWFERMNCTHLWVHDWEFNYDKPIILDTKKTWVHWDKMLLYFRTLYWTGEIVWGGMNKRTLPYEFKPWDIFSAPVFSPTENVSVIEEVKPTKPRRGRRIKSVDSEKKTI